MVNFWKLSVRKKSKFQERIRIAIESVVSSNSMSVADDDSWTRENGWKTDMVVLGFKETYFYLNVYVNLPPKPGTPFDFQTLAMKNLPTLCGHSDAVYRYPAFSFQTSRLITRIENELKVGMQWFDTLSTPSACLAYLHADTNSNPASDGYQHQESYLRELIN